MTSFINGYFLIEVILFNNLFTFPIKTSEETTIKMHYILQQKMKRRTKQFLSADLHLFV